MKKPAKTRTPTGASQRQLRAGELIRHALVEVMRGANVNDPLLGETSVTVTQVRVSPDLRHAIVFVEPLGGTNATDVVAALNQHSKFFRGRLGHSIDMRFTPDLKFVHDESFDVASRINQLFDDPKVRADLVRGADPSHPNSRRDPPPRGDV